MCEVINKACPIVDISQEIRNFDQRIHLGDSRDELAANGNSGNGNLRPETFDRSRRQWAAEMAEKTQQTD
jgi:hypothetical protein